VTTLVGFYDPDGALASYIYPALHGAYGFTYPNDNADIDTNDCQLQVTTNNGTQSFRLANGRREAGLMNKFHVNIPADADPASAAILCGNSTLAERSIEPASATLTFTTNGETQ